MPQVTLGSVQPHKEGILVTLDEVTDRASADRLRGVSLLIDPAQRRSLGADEYWPQDLIGLAVRDVAGLELGVVVEVVAGFGQDRLRVAAEQGEFEVPFVADLVTEVDVARNRLIVDLPDGLIELAT